MKAISLFAGIGGFDLALERNGITVVRQVERDTFCQRVLAARWPGVARADDVSTFLASDVREPASDDGGSGIDLLVGGFPCQDLSVAGKRAGLGGTRSSLFHEFIRIAKLLKPTYGLVENVPGLFSSDDGRDMATVLEGLRQCWPVVGYCVLDSQYFGVPQRRRRVFLVGGPTEARVEEILFEPEGGSGDLAPSGKARPELATDIAACLGGAGGGPRGFHSDAETGLVTAASLRSRSHRPGVNIPGRGGEDDMNLVVDALTARDSKGFDRGDSSHNSKLIYVPDQAACLNPGHEAKHSYAGDGGTMNILCQAITNLGSGGPDDNEAQANHLIAFHPAQLTSKENRSNPQPGDPCPTLPAEASGPMIAHPLRADGFDASEDGTGRGTPLVPVEQYLGGEIITALDASYGKGTGGRGACERPIAVQTCGVRRLTPTECERLQGFPDGWTCLCQPLKTYDSEQCTCPDGPRYKALGNAVTVSVIEWLAKRLAR